MGRITLLLVALAIGELDGPASAQDYIDPPPNVMIDENGVNLADGRRLSRYQISRWNGKNDPAYQRR